MVFAEWLASQSQKFIKSALDAEKPFFLYYATPLEMCVYSYAAMFGFDITQSTKGTLTGDEVPTDTTMQSREDIWARALAYDVSFPETEEYAKYFWLVCACTCDEPCIVFEMFALLCSIGSGRAVWRFDRLSQDERGVR